ncbi:MAG: DUF3530 family protein [Pontibacterium sp.]
MLLYLSPLRDKAFLPQSLCLSIINAMIIRIPQLCLLLCLLVPAAFAAEDTGTAQNDEDTAAPVEQPAIGATENPAPSAQPRMEPDPALNQLNDIAKSAQPETEVIWLETAEDRTLALFHPQSQAELSGGVIIFPNEGTHADWPDSPRPLRLHLSDQGWHTLSIQLPAPPIPEIPKRTLPTLKRVDTPARAPETDAEIETTTPATPAIEIPTPPAEPDPGITEARMPYPERLKLLGEAAWQTLKQRQAETLVVIGTGTGAYWAAQFILDHQETGEAMGLLMLNPQTPPAQSDADLPGLLAKLKTPVVDIYQSRPYRSLGFEADSRQRLRTARRNKLTQYYQRRLSNRHLSWEKQERWLSQQVTGLIDRHILKPLSEDKPETDKAEEKPAEERAPGQTVKARPI